MSGLGKERLAEMKRHGEALEQDGRCEGAMLLELVTELDQLQDKAARVVRELAKAGRSNVWTPAQLQDALDTLIAEYMSEMGGEKRPSNTTVMELILWNGKRAKAAGRRRS